ncbi:MAG: hypothetical protein VW405_17675 [Rhodospirillaceae bacterium]
MPLNAVVTVMLCAVCEPDLLNCAPVFHWRRLWATVADCRTDRARVGDAVRARAGAGKTVLTRCRLYLDDAGELRRTLLSTRGAAG